MQLAGSGVNIILNNSLKAYGGDLAIGANGIIISIALLFVMLIVGVSQGMQPIVGYNYGAGNYQRVNQTLRLVLISSTFITGVGCLCGLLIPERIVRIFTIDPALIEIAANGLRLTLLLFFVVGSQITISQFFQSIGKAWISIFLGLSRQCLFLIPCVLFLPPVLGLNGIWYSSPFSDLMAAVFAWGFLLWHVKNMKNKIFH